MPAQRSLQRAEPAARQPLEIPMLTIAVIDVIGGSIGENVFYIDPIDGESIRFEQPLGVPVAVSVSHWTAGLGFGVPGHDFVGIPKASLSLQRHDPEHFPGIAIINHQLQSALRGEIRPQLSQDPFWMRTMMDHAEGIDKIIRLCW